MTRPELFSKLGTILDTAERDQSFGTVELEIRGGKIVLLRTIKTEKIEDSGHDTHVDQKHR
jgi:hypothetical protein